MATLWNVQEYRASVPRLYEFSKPRILKCQLVDFCPLNIFFLTTVLCVNSETRVTEWSEHWIFRGRAATSPCLDVRSWVFHFSGFRFPCLPQCSLIQQIFSKSKTCPGSWGCCDGDRFCLQRKMMTYTMSLKQVMACCEGTVRGTRQGLGEVMEGFPRGMLFKLRLQGRV